MAGDKPSWSQIKKRLHSWSRESLLGLVQDLFAQSAENRMFLAARLLGGSQELPAGGIQVLEPYRERVIRVFFSKRGFQERLKLGEGRKAVREYRKATNDSLGTLELMMTYMETGTRYTEELGDIDEPFYDSLCRMMEEIERTFRMVDNHKLYLGFRARLLDLAERTKIMGWGYGDFVNDTVWALEKSFAPPTSASAS